MCEILQLISNFEHHYNNYFVFARPNPDFLYINISYKLVYNKENKTVLRKQDNIY